MDVCSSFRVCRSEAAIAAKSSVKAEQAEAATAASGLGRVADGSGSLHPWMMEDMEAQRDWACTYSEADRDAGRRRRSVASLLPQLAPTSEASMKKAVVRGIARTGHAHAGSVYVAGRAAGVAHSAGSECRGQGWVELKHASQLLDIA